ncbi:MarR family winged helix-turn-helix transcriptional regulator [Shewanella woodyi]|uniref:MarR family winged helix-turn-helix transcriptional regulator n=1 Tax=Shewanella woodyi TaxID=60961 RepID=UPI003749D58B
MSQAKLGQTSISLNQFLPYRLVNLAQKVSVNFAEVYQSEFNLTTPEWRILVHLAELTLCDKSDGAVRQQSTGISAKELTQLASMDKSTVSRAVKLMLDKGYITKQVHIADKRAFTLTLTTAGFTLYQTIAPKALEWEKSLLKALDKQEYQALMQILDKLDSKLS